MTIAAREKHGRGRLPPTGRHPARSNGDVFRFPDESRCATTEGEGGFVAGMTYWRQEWDEDAAKALLAAHRLGQTGLAVKLDKGFEPGVYGITVEYGEAAGRLGFTAARWQARHYATGLHGQLSRLAGDTLDDLDDASLGAGPGRKRDLESTFITFALTMEDGNWHDDAMKERFRTALLRAEQEWDQHQARVAERRRDSRREKFLQRFSTLLEGEAYRQIDAATKECLLAEVMALVFPARGQQR